MPPCTYSFPRPCYHAAPDAPHPSKRQRRAPAWLTNNHVVEGPGTAAVAAEPYYPAPTQQRQRGSRGAGGRSHFVDEDDDGEDDEDDEGEEEGEEEEEEEGAGAGAAPYPKPPAAASVKVHTSLMLDPYTLGR